MAAQNIKVIVFATTPTDSRDFEVLRGKRFLNRGKMTPSITTEERKLHKFLECSVQGGPFQIGADVTTLSWDFGMNFTTFTWGPASRKKMSPSSSKGSAGRLIGSFDGYGALCMVN